ncbi:MAG TPA: hypothetical protein VFC19_34680 [Candidatus Limnocylindrales bacterium]|nr:hypothetical protein [Candidatus Limnocylindrales bacterium]
MAFFGPAVGGEMFLDDVLDRVVVGSRVCAVLCGTGPGRHEATVVLADATIDDL